MPTVLVFDVDRLSEADTDRLHRVAPAERRARADRFHFAADRRRCLAAGALLRHALLTRHGLTPGDLDTARDAYGKPYLVRVPDLHFSLSHAGRWVACGTSGTEIGVDIEHTDAGAVDISHRFAPDEHAYVAAAPADRRARRLVRIWTLKESYVKYLGRGLSVPMDSFSVRAPDRRPRILRGTLDPRPRLEQVPHGDDYWLAACSREDTGISVVEPTRKDLLAASDLPGRLRPRLA
ncbi:4'-phosphopantetheinyl transferase family protein [Streptomyces sp. NPDC053750]|uniref:4'-phosphopantetheinyl transferase family protein n=1 Tax=Streptomyces sp. NPDC053750 TaxID=3365714 RepID=UPI0037CF9B30